MSSSAQAQVYSSRYGVSLNGVHIGDAIMHTTLSAKNYKVEVSADVGVLLNNTKIQGEASGSRAGAKLTPAHFHLVTSDGAQSTVDFAATAAAGAKTNPLLKGILDPLSALLLTSLRPASTADAPCNNVMPVILGRARFSISLHPQPASEAPAELVTATCQVEFNAIAGYPAGGLDKLKMEIFFQKLSKPHLWLPERVSMPTDMGIVTFDREQTQISAS